MGRPVVVQAEDKSESAPERCPAVVAIAPGWESVSRLHERQISVLQGVATRGVFWQHPTSPACNAFTLHYGGDVEADGNCLFSAVQRAMQLKQTAGEIRQRAVQKFMTWYEASDTAQRVKFDKIIKNLYCPDVSSGWGLESIKYRKLLIKKEDQEAVDAEIKELIVNGTNENKANESVYKKHCTPVDNASSWAKYMCISGQSTEEYAIVSLLYTEDGLLDVQSGGGGTVAAFGDDIALEALATEFERQIFVVQVHGGEDSEGMLFFLPHNPLQEITHPPVFLLMRGTDYCAAGADHYEPLMAKPLPVASKEKTAFVL